MNFTETEFQCRRGELTIRGKMLRPEKDGLLPIAITSHGFMANGESMRPYAEFLAGEGYCTFFYDFCGGCLHGASDGKTTDMTVLTEVMDLMAVMDYALSLPFTRSEDLILLGGSQGGFVSALTAARRKEQVSRIILLFPAFCIPDDARRGQLISASFDPADIPESFPCGPFLLGRAYPEAVMEMDPFQEISPYTGPVLIIHGDADGLVNVEYARKAFAAYQRIGRGREAAEAASAVRESGDAGRLPGRSPRPEVCLHILEGADHGFTEAENEHVFFAVRMFLQGYTEVLTVDVELTGEERKPLTRAEMDEILGDASPFSECSSSGAKNRAGQHMEEEICVRKRETEPFEGDSPSAFSRLTLPFTGTAASPWFSGRILPGAADVQIWEGDKPISVCATYSIEGEDYTGAHCTVNVVNTGDESGNWRPVVTTDSKALSWFDGARGFADLEHRKKGPMVRIYQKIV